MVFEMLTSRIRPAPASQDLGKEFNRDFLATRSVIVSGRN
jgi:hypothetical protein